MGLFLALKFYHKKFKMKLNKIITHNLIIILLSFLSSCNYSILKNSDNGQDIKYNLTPEKLSQLSYNKLASSVFSTNCTSCHGNSGRINLESYSEVLKNLSLIKKVVFFDKTMPKNSNLNEDQLSNLWNWIKLGAPEKPEDTQQDLLVPTYDSINKHVFQTSCKDCHNAAGSAPRVLFDRQSLLNSPRELVLPGNPDESGLVLALERTDDNRMPPAKEGYSEVSQEIKNIIRLWIMNGAKD